jgi:thymidylate synthase ThyX
VERRAGGGHGRLHLDAGEDVAREIARIDLPLSTYTQWYWKIDLHNLLHFLSLRWIPTPSGRSGPTPRSWRGS